MAKLTIRGSERDKVQALFGVYPWLKKICGESAISVICVLPGNEMATHSYSESANGFNTTGSIHFIEKGKVVNEVTWDEVHEHRKAQRLPQWALNSPQTELSGSQNACVLVQRHHDEDDGPRKWISVEVFVCSAGYTFAHFPEVTAWLREPSMRGELRTIGIYPAELSTVGN